MEAEGEWEGHMEDLQADSIREIDRLKAINKQIQTEKHELQRQVAWRNRLSTRIHLKISELCICLLRSQNCVTPH